MGIGDMIKKMAYGATGAILTRVGTGVVRGFVPTAFASASYIEPALQALVAVVPVRWVGRKFLGQAQADMMVLGGLISAGLAAADAYFPNVQQQLSGIIRLPITTAQQVLLPGATTPVTGSGLGDVYDVDMVAAGFGDVEEIPAGMWA